MKLIQALKGIFSKSAHEQSQSSEPEQAKIFDLEAYIAQHLADTDKESTRLLERYGPDFTAFLYRPNLDLFIRQEILPFRNPAWKNADFLDNDHWAQRHPFNFPGPFYTGESDTCGTGNPEAPYNILFDSYTCEYVFRQPQTYIEFLCVLDAAAIEVFDSYSCNGNNYWTYQKCKEWWSGKSDLLNKLNGAEIRKANGEDIRYYIDYLNSAAETDLRKYCYFLENGYYPTDETIHLPEL